MEDDILKDDEGDELEPKLSPETEVSGDALDEDPESVDDLADKEEEGEEEEPFDDINPF